MNGDVYHGPVKAAPLLYFKRTSRGAFLMCRHGNGDLEVLTWYPHDELIDMGLHFQELPA